METTEMTAQTSKRIQINTDKIKRMANENIEKILDLLDINFFDSGVDLSSACPIHGGDNPQAWVYSKEKMIWSCFTQQCNKRFGNDIIGLVSAVRECNFIEATTWLKKVLNLSTDDINVDSEILYIQSIASNASKEKTHKIYDRECLNRLIENYDYFTSRGYDRSTLNNFNCGYAESGKMFRRMVFPIEDINNNIVGFTGRIIYEKCKICDMYHKEGKDFCRYGTKAKWLNSKDTPKSTVIFNLNRAMEYIKSSKKLIIVEGIPDVMRLWQNGIKNVVCVLGVGLNKKQLTTLISIGVISDIYLCTDQDKAGKNFKNTHSTYKDDDVEQLSRYFNVHNLTLNKKDFGDMTDKEVVEFAIAQGWIKEERKNEY